MTLYQLFLLVVLVIWPIAIFVLLFLMDRLESYVARIRVEHPEQAGLEPVSGASEEREVKIVYGDEVIG
jgi:hypothetical protein